MALRRDGFAVTWTSPTNCPMSTRRRGCARPALNNLIDNAVRYSDGRELWITARANDGAVTIGSATARVGIPAMNFADVTRKVLSRTQTVSGGSGLQSRHRRPYRLGPGTWPFTARRDRGTTVSVTMPPHSHEKQCCSSNDRC